ncbi:MAG: 5'/3'-nucleotidase SurE, partial [Anaerovorax sp.]
AVALEFTGTPADCVKLGLEVLKERDVHIDMVFSGINHGGNLGTDTLYSGTVSAAIEGCICGIPAVAVSVNDHAPKHFELACRLAVSACQKAFGKMDEKTVLNINVPNLPDEEVKGVKVTRLGAREYDGWFQPRVNDAGETSFWYSGKPVVYEGLSNDVDVVSMQEGYASITPLQYDFTNYKLIEEVKNWGI